MLSVADFCCIGLLTFSCSKLTFKFADGLAQLCNIAVGFGSCCCVLLNVALCCLDLEAKFAAGVCDPFFVCGIRGSLLLHHLLALCFHLGHHLEYFLHRCHRGGTAAMCKSC